MKEDSNIDKLFREGTQKEYPYDENLWAQVESKLPNNSENSLEKSSWKNTFRTLLALVLILFIKTDSIVSFNLYNPRQVNELTNLYTSTDSDHILAVNTKKQTTSKTTTPNSSIEQSELKKPSKASQNNSTKDQFTKPLTENSQTAFERITLNQTKENQKEPNLSNESNKSKALAETNEDELKAEATISQKDLVINSVFEEKESTLPTTRELSKLNALGFLIKSNYPQSIPKGIEENKLHELQQKFKKRNYFIEVELGRSFRLNKNLSSLDANQNKYREEAENSRLQQSMGLNILTNIKQFTVGIGIHLSSFHEQLNYSYNQEVNEIKINYDTSYSVINGNFNSNGTPVILIRENINENRTEVTENVERELVINNHFKRISLPLSIGYTKSFGRFNAGLRTAIVFNYLSVSSGGYISNNRDNFYGFEEKEQLEQWIIGNRNQIRLGYSLNEFVAIGTSLNHEQDLSSFTQDYSSKFNSFGLGIWLLYRPR